MNNEAGGGMVLQGTAIERLFSPVCMCPDVVPGRKGISIRCRIVTAQKTERIVHGKANRLFLIRKPEDE